MDLSRRTAGWATIGFAAAFVITFVVNSTINLAIAFPRYPLADDMASQFWYGVLVASLWSLAGVAIGVAAVALPRVLWEEPGVADGVATLFGAVATTGWILSGAAPFAQRTALLNDNIAAAGATPEAESAVVEGLFVLVHVGGVIFALAAVPWLGLIAWRSAGRLPIAATVLLWLAAILPYGTFVVTGLQFGILGMVVALGLLGLVLLRSARNGVDHADVGRSAGTGTDTGLPTRAS